MSFCRSTPNDFISVFFYPAFRDRLICFEANTCDDSFRLCLNIRNNCVEFYDMFFCIAITLIRNPKCSEILTNVTLCSSRSRTGKGLFSWCEKLQGLGCRLKSFITTFERNPMRLKGAAGFLDSHARTASSILHFR